MPDTAKDLSSYHLRQDKERPGRAEDVVRLYDALVAFAADLGDLAADLGGAAGEYLIDEAAAQVPSSPPFSPSPSPASHVMDPKYLTQL